MLTMNHEVRRMKIDGTENIGEIQYRSDSSIKSVLFFDRSTSSSFHFADPVMVSTKENLRNRKSGEKSQIIQHPEKPEPRDIAPAGSGLISTKCRPRKIAPKQQNAPRRGGRRVRILDGRSRVCPA